MSTRKTKHTLRARRTTKPAPVEFIVPGLSRAALESIMRRPGSAANVITMREFRQQLAAAGAACGEDRTRQVMRNLVAAGWARAVRKNVVSLSGVTQPVAAYEFLAKQETPNG